MIHVAFWLQAVVQAHDKDDAGNVSSVKYRMLPTARFTGLFTVNPTTGAFRVDGKLDRERRPAAYLMVEASNEAGDWHQGKANCQVIITIADVNDNPPRLHGPKVVELPWPPPGVGTEIATLNATDPDNGANGTVAGFEFDGSSSKAGVKAFAVSEGGVVTIAKALEPQTEYEIPVLMRDAGTPQQVGRSHITVVVAATTTTSSTSTQSTTTLTTTTATGTSTTTTGTNTSAFKMASAKEIADAVASMRGNSTSEDNDDHVEQAKKGLSSAITAILVVVGLVMLGLCIGLPICLHKRTKHDETNKTKAAWNKEYREAAIKNPVFIHSSGHGDGLENPNYADIPANSDKSRAEGAVANPTYGSAGPPPASSAGNGYDGPAAESMYDSVGAVLGAAGAFPASASASASAADSYVDVAAAGNVGEGEDAAYVEVGAAADSETDAYVVVDAVAGSFGDGFDGDDAAGGGDAVHYDEANDGAVEAVEYAPANSDDDFEL